MGNERANALAVYLIGLALLESNGETYVSSEIRQTMREVEKELGIKN